MIDEREGVTVAFLGNSILYYNDCPRFLENLSKGAISQDSCLRGGTNLHELWKLGNGMRKHGWATENAKIDNADGDAAYYDVGAPNVKTLLDATKKWDYVVFNDHTQGPARPEKKQVTQDVLVEKYLPLLLDCLATPIIIETAAYRYEGIVNSQDLGSTHEFQKRVREGIEDYIQVLGEKMESKSIKPKIAPVGTAYLYVHDTIILCGRNYLIHMTTSIHLHRVHSYRAACCIA